MGRVGEYRNNLKIVIEIIIAYMGALSIIHILSSSDVLALNAGIHAIVVFVLVAAVSMLYESDVWKYARFIYPAGCLLLIVINLRKIRMAVIYTYQMIREKQYYGINYDKTKYLQRGADKYNEVVGCQEIFMILLAFVLAYVFVIIVKKAYLVMATFAASALIVMFTMFDCVPDVFSFILAVVFVLAVASLKYNPYGYINSCKIIGITYIVSVFVLIAIRPDNYERSEILVNLGTLINASIDEFNGVVSHRDDQNNLVNNGQIGGIDEIKYEDVVQVKYTTMPTGHAQYIPEFYGAKFISGENRWKEKKYMGSVGLVSADKQGIVRSVKESEAIARYIAGDDDIENAFNIYKFSANNVIDKSVQSGYSAYVSNHALSAMYNLSKGTNTDIASSVRKEFSGMTAGKYKGEDVLSIDDEYKTLFEKMFGTINIESYEDIEAYTKLIKRYFQEEFTYTLSPGKVPYGEDFIEYFLLESKEGYCTYYATAATLMFRYAGIPARYVEGWAVSDADIKKGKATYLGIILQYRLDESKSLNCPAFEVELKDSNAHAWVEIYVDGYGWTPIEVTPYVENQLGENTNLIGEKQDDIIPEESESETYSETQNETESQDDTDSENTTDEASTDQSKTDENAMDGNISDTTVEIDGKGVVKKIMKLAAGILLLMSFVIFIWTRYAKITKIKRTLNTGSPKEVVIVIERLMAKTKYARPESRDYVDYARYLESTSELFKAHDYRQAVEMAVKERFGNGLREDELQYFNDLLRDELILLHEEIIKEQNMAKQIIIKYIQIR